MTTIEVVDAAGRRVYLPVFPFRIISLVPSITETLFMLGLDERLVGVTRYCTEPSARVAQKAKVGGQKDPDLKKIQSLHPDLVIANVEENRREDVEAMEAMGIAVYTTYPRTVGQGIAMIRDLGRMTGTEEKADAIALTIESLHQGISKDAARQRPVRVFCPIWRKPYMSINGDTYIHDVLRTCGGANIFAEKNDRYPKISLAEVADLDVEVIILPDEPYPFHPRHLVDFQPFKAFIPALRTGRVHFVDGKLLSWYGPRIAESLRTLRSLLLS
ncbi:MAG: cobalamin-binding protein [candidate division NC10 bacterium]|nr:cobalamin-binding protein [candidate division NC10 bacterium]